MKHLWKTIQASDKKRALLVFGPEGSGTRITTRSLLEVGGEGGHTEHQRFDRLPPMDQRLAVWRRSFPHYRTWPAPVNMIETCETNGYDVTVVVCVRDCHAIAKSNIKKGVFTSLAEARQRINEAYQRIFRAINVCDVDYLMFPFDSIIREPKALEATFAALRLPKPVTEFTDQNGKYYE